MSSMSERDRLRLMNILEPFVRAADEADSRDEAHRRLFQYHFNENATVGLGLSFKNLRDLRAYYNELHDESVVPEEMRNGQTRGAYGPRETTHERRTTRHTSRGHQDA